MMPSEMAHLPWLRYPCYGLYHLNSLAESEAGGYLYDIVPTFESAFSAADRARILDALAWAESAINLDWERILPDMPHPEAFKRRHLAITRQRLMGGPGS